MKKIISGSILMFSGIILFCIAYIPGVNYMPRVSSWFTPPGKFLTSVIEAGGLLPFITGICLFLCGITFLLWGTFEK